EEEVRELFLRRLSRRQSLHDDEHEEVERHDEDHVGDDSEEDRAYAPQHGRLLVSALKANVAGGDARALLAPARGLFGRLGSARERETRLGRAVRRGEEGVA